MPLSFYPPLVAAVMLFLSLTGTSLVESLVGPTTVPLSRIALFDRRRSSSFRSLPPQDDENRNPHQEPEHCNDDCSSRRAFLWKTLLTMTMTIGGFSDCPQLASAATTTTEQGGESITMPLIWIASLSAYIVKYQVGGDHFGAILDTGSPFLTVPGYCDPHKWGCYRPESSQPTGLAPTYEQFDHVQGQVEWRKAPFAFVNATGQMLGPPEMTFGVFSESLLGGPGGVFLGLVRDTEDWIRPSFLGQTNVRAFEIDLASTIQKSLTLTTFSLINGDNDYIPLTNDLNRKYGDPTLHYTARASSIMVNGSPLIQPKDRKPIYVIFDTGVTGMVVSDELFQERYATARRNHERNLWGNVQVSFRTQQGETITIQANRPLTTPLAAAPWPKFNAHLVVVGLSFLDNRRMLVDIDDKKLWIA